MIDRKLNVPPSMAFMLTYVSTSAIILRIFEFYEISNQRSTNGIFPVLERKKFFISKLIKVLILLILNLDSSIPLRTKGVIVFEL